MTHRIVYDSSDTIKFFNYGQLFLFVKNFVCGKTSKSIIYQRKCYYDRF